MGIFGNFISLELVYLFIACCPRRMTVKKRLTIQDVEQLPHSCAPSNAHYQWSCMSLYHWPVVTLVISSLRYRLLDHLLCANSKKILRSGHDQDSARHRCQRLSWTSGGAGFSVRRMEHCGHRTYSSQPSKHSQDRFDCTS